MGAHGHSNTKRIWKVFAYLSVITIIEVALGIVKPAVLLGTKVLSFNLLNWIFLILTIVKGYYIMWAFMHLEGEKKSFRWSIAAPLVFLILYLSFILLCEADYVFEKTQTGFGFGKWNFFDIF